MLHITIINLPLKSEEETNTTWQQVVLVTRQGLASRDWLSDTTVGQELSLGLQVVVFPATLVMLHSKL